MLSHYVVINHSRCTHVYFNIRLYSLTQTNYSVSCSLIMCQFNNIQKPNVYSVSIAANISSFFTVFFRLAMIISFLTLLQSIINHTHIRHETTIYCLCNNAFLCTSCLCVCVQRTLPSKFKPYSEDTKFAQTWSRETPTRTEPVRRRTAAPRRPTMAANRRDRSWRRNSARMTRVCITAGSLSIFL